MIRVYLPLAEGEKMGDPINPEEFPKVPEKPTGNLTLADKQKLSAHFAEPGETLIVEDEEFWRKFLEKPDLPGVVGNCVVVLRDQFAPTKVGESQDAAALKKFATKICEHLAKNGITRINVACRIAAHARDIITDSTSGSAAWTGQPGDQKKSDSVSHKEINVPDDTDPAVQECEVTVIMMMDCYGHYHQRKMYALVREGFQNSSLGVIMLGYRDIMQVDNFSDSEWITLVAGLEEYYGIQDHLQIRCSIHSSVCKIRGAYDLQSMSPNGGCDIECGKMECGHYCRRPCHPQDPRHTSLKYRCEKRCRRVCPNGHRSCDLPCYGKCEDCCEIITVINRCEHTSKRKAKVFCWEQEYHQCRQLALRTLPCGHSVVLGCHQFGPQYTIKCVSPVMATFACGHFSFFPCNYPLAKLRCRTPIVKTQPCDHTVGMYCYEWTENREFVCQAICRATLDCGHNCTRACYLCQSDPEHKTYECPEPCNKMCRRHTHKCKGDHPCHLPCNPCMEEVLIPLPCAHSLRIVCNEPNPDVTTVYCKEKCTRTLLYCSHFCVGICGDKCADCEVIVYKQVPNCTRDHMDWFRCGDRTPRKCVIKVAPLHPPPCGHHFEVKCYKSGTKDPYVLASLCPSDCNAVLDGEGECGHQCRGTCSNCFQGRFHLRCTENCGKPLICGHVCTSPCGMACPPCCHPCFNSCEHATCKFECCVPCERNCQEPCSYQCPHSKCSKKCFEVCDKTPCNLPCPKLLACGHSCVGICGELCPPHCRICHPEELVPGLLSANASLESNTRFLYLRNCHHCVEANDMDAWVNLKSDEILVLRCPRCMDRLPWIPRYSAQLDENFKLINAVRKRIFGPPDEIQKIQASIKEKVTAFMKKTGGNSIFDSYIDFFLREVGCPIASPALPNPKGTGSFSIEAANFLNWMCEDWIQASKVLLEFSKNLPEEHYQDFEKLWKEYFLEMAENRDWPMHPNEIKALKVERNRLDDAITLFSMCCQKSTEAPTVVPQEMLDQAKSIILQAAPYTEKNREEFKNALKELEMSLNYTLKISDTERQEIVSAFGGGAGRWFKCINGHIYVVTECGGATEQGSCNVCGAPIGGQNHVLEEYNYLATEMDGAEAPLYPTVLQRN